MLSLCGMNVCSGVIGITIAAFTISMREPGAMRTKLCAMSSVFSTSSFTFAPGFHHEAGRS